MQPVYKSLSEVHESVAIPQRPGMLRRLFAFAGPAYLVSVGYMDPGNWATDIAAGSRYGYSLLWVLLMSNAMAILLQGLSARLGMVSGQDLAQACRRRYPKSVNIVLWLLCEAAIAACDLAEVIGSAVGLQLLFGLPLVAGVLVTVLDTFLLLFLHQKGIRRMEAFILVMVVTIGGCFFAEVLMARPDLPGIVKGFWPTLPDVDALYFAVGIIGATVMPHNLYLHSSLVQSRKVVKTARGLRQALRFNRVDSFVALNLAFLINAAILVMAAAVFFRSGHFAVAEIQDAHRLLAPIVGSGVAPVLFALALICAGQSSTITGTLAGQIVMEGFLSVRLQPWLRRLVTRAIAIIPAVAVIVLMGEQATGRLMVLSQVVLSLQLPFAVIPLIRMVSDRKLMGAFEIPAWEKTLAWVVAGLITALNGKLLFGTLSGWLAGGGGGASATRFVAAPVSVALGLLLLYLLAEPYLRGRTRKGAPGEPGVHGGGEIPALELSPPFRKVGAALDFGPTDREVLSRAAAMASASGGRLVLVHVVESAASRALGLDAGDRESVEDLERLQRHAIDLGKFDVDAEAVLGYGDPVRAIAEIVRERGIDLLVVGAHGHRGLADVVHGSTINELRHRLEIAVLVVRHPDV